IRRLLRVQRARYRTRQNHVAVDRIDGDRVVRQDAVEHRLEREQIALDLDFEIEDLAAVLVEEEDVRLTDLPADQVDGALGTENVRRFRRQVNSQRLVQGYAHEPGAFRLADRDVLDVPVGGAGFGSRIAWGEGAYRDPQAERGNQSGDQGPATACHPVAVRACRCHCLCSVTFR